MIFKPDEGEIEISCCRENLCKSFSVQTYRRIVCREIMGRKDILRWQVGRSFFDELFSAAVIIGARQGIDISCRIGPIGDICLEPGIIENALSLLLASFCKGDDGERVLVVVTDEGEGVAVNVSGKVDSAHKTEPAVTESVGRAIKLHEGTIWFSLGAEDAFIRVFIPRKGEGDFCQLLPTAAEYITDPFSALNMAFSSVKKC